MPRWETQIIRGYIHYHMDGTHRIRVSYIYSVLLFTLYAVIRALCQVRSTEYRVLHQVYPLLDDTLYSAVGKQRDIEDEVLDRKHA